MKKNMWQTISVRKYEKLGKHFPYSTRHRAVASTYGIADNVSWMTQINSRVENRSDRVYIKELIAI